MNVKNLGKTRKKTKVFFNVKFLFKCKKRIARICKNFIKISNSKIYQKKGY